MLPDEQIQIDKIVYRRYGQIGQGTCGHVYIVTSPQKKKYALKIINDYGRNPILQDMIDREIETQAKFTSCNFIIRIYAHMQRHKKMYILFQLGTCSLRNLITMNTHVQLIEFLEICLDTTKGIYAIHSKQLIHRDIKPQNIICVDKTYKITDFGSLQGGTAGDQFIGTTLYMPPELLNGEKYTQKLDVWSLGVSLFQTYFRIHPFYYLDYEEVDAETAKHHLQKNIKRLLPNFTMQKFIALANQKVRSQKIQQIKNIAAVTPPQLIEQFTNFFQYHEQRPDIEFFVGAFESLRDLVDDRQCKKTKLEMKIEQLPSDIKFYVDTLNLFYELISSYGTNKFLDVQFHLQLGLWYWNFYNYVGQKYIKYSNYPALKAYRKDKKILWDQVKSALFDYWLELNSNKDLQFFSQLPILKLRVLLCAARFDIIRGEQETDLFLKKTSARIKMQITTLDQLQSYLPIFQIYQLKAIQEILTNKYFCK